MPIDPAFSASLVDGPAGTDVDKALLDDWIAKINAVVEGTATAWTPTDASGAGLTLTNGGSWFLKTGRQVVVWLDVTYPTTANTANAKIGGLPFTVNAGARAALTVGFGNKGALNLLLPGGLTQVHFYSDGTGGPKTNADLTGGTFVASGVYLV